LKRWKAPPGHAVSATLLYVLAAAACAPQARNVDPEPPTAGDRDAREVTGTTGGAEGTAGNRGGTDSAAGGPDDGVGSRPAGSGSGGNAAADPFADAATPADRIPTSEDTDRPTPDAAPTDTAVIFENSLGMRFVSVPGTAVRFSIWETRMEDFDAYARATGAAIPRPDFSEAPLQPKAAVSRAQAQAFAEWLTRTERSKGRIGAAASYRLPTDSEWNVAMGVGKPSRQYPWGDTFPPPDDFANYGVTKDGFEFTAPVGSFPANSIGLYDMAGNLWEWIGDPCDKGGAFLVRGGAFNAKNPPYFALGFHYCFAGDLIGHHNVGFRLVLQGV
jgi:hypothetical protein